MSVLEQLSKYQYLNVETFRKSGVGVRTPVWFVQDGNTIYIRTQAQSGKVKRIRNNPQVNIAPCKVDGELLGGWVAAKAHEVTDRSVHPQIDRLFDRKYGLMKKFFALLSALQKRQYAILAIQPLEEQK
ncbi:MAG: PPOX class F420-dependent oxidoreductase [Anaerolineae bacterium]|nr:PPOX class F420-dependent oxidoreductase [Anaerolineae bacterium]